MRHPFDGILPANENDQPEGATRRQALHWLAGASAAPIVAACMQTTLPAGEAEAESSYDLYFVVPEDFRAFSSRRRGDLGIQGSYLPGLASHEELAKSKGFLAWKTAEEAAELKKTGDVKRVHQMQAEDVAELGVPPEKGALNLRIYAAPFEWKMKLPKGSFQSMEELGETWTKQFSMHEGVKVVASKAARTPFVSFVKGEVPKAVIDAIKEHPQVYAIQWMTPFRPDTTKAVGEEGGITTQALGEEGGVTTQALGEEGGRPRPSTRALGEEGGVRPKPQPTTLALGEEGGRGKAPAILPKEPPQRVTTQAIGEEGG